MLSHYRYSVDRLTPTWDNRADGYPEVLLSGPLDTRGFEKWSIHLEYDFPALLAKLRQERGLSQAALAQAVGANRSTVSYAESGERRPSRESVIQFARALTLTAGQADELLVAAGYAPTLFDRLRPTDPDFQFVAHFLAGDGVSEARREQFRRLLRDLAAFCGYGAQ